jgi:hypothetical protein
MIGKKVMSGTCAVGRQKIQVMKSCIVFSLLEDEGCLVAGADANNPGVYYALVDGGSAVIVGPWNFGSHVDAEAPLACPNLAAVSGESIAYYGEHKIP